MLKHIAAFEWRYQVRSPVFLISCLIFFLLSFGAVTVDSIQIGSRGNVNVNAPVAILQMQGVMSLFAVFVMVAMVASAVLRDHETRFAPIIHTTSVTPGRLLAGRFIGATAAAFCVMAMVPAAVAVGSLMPWLDPEKIGAFHLADYLYALFAFGLPTLLIVSAGLFALATLTRSMMWTYVLAIGVVMLDLVMGALLRDPAHATVAALADPFGASALTVVTRYWTASERNTLLPPLTGLLLANRLLWTGVAVALFAATCRFFRFEQRASARTRPVNPPDEAPVPVKAPAGVRAPTGDAGTLQAQLRQLWHLVRFDAAFVLRSPVFFVLLGIGVLNSAGNLWFAGQIYGADSLPVTRLMVQTLMGSFALMPTLIAVLYAGELVWRDREQRIHEIVDATSAPDWTHLLPKLLAVALVLAVSVGVGVLSGMAVQLLKGHTDVQLARYALWFLLPMTINALLLAVLSVFVQVAVPQKQLGWAVMLLFIVANVAMSGAGWEHQLVHYAGTTPVPLSDMNGMGRFWVGAAWLQLYWSGFALMLAVVSQLLWRRGTQTALAPRLRQLPRRLAGRPLALMATGAAVWLGAGAFIFYNTNLLNRYETEADRDERLARMEKMLLPFEALDQPTITAVTLDVQLFPREARLAATGSYEIENRTRRPMAELHLNWSGDSSSDKLELEAVDIPGATVGRDYPGLHYRVYTLSPAMAPGEKRTVRFRTMLGERGFPNSRPLTAIVENGSFIKNTEFTPGFGIQRSTLLKDRAKRRKYGLPAELGLARLEDDGAQAFNMLRHDSAFVSADISVTTDADQTPMAPGVTVMDATANGRRTVRFKSDAPMLNYFSIQSARYTVARDHWNGVDLAVYHHPEHGHNVARMLRAMKASLALFSERFAPYQFHQARIVEFPAFGDFAESFANTIPYSESVGFLFAQDDPAKADMVTYFTAHEIAHQWWGHQLMPADKQGGSMLLESLAQYSALLVMEKLQGRDQLRAFTKRELDAYLRARGGEAATEQPLARVENQPYIHYNKGSLAMYWLREVVGEAVVDRVLANMLDRHALKGAPYADTREFIALLKAETGPAHEPLITDLFEKITVYDVKLTEATVRRRADGRFDLTLGVEAHKFYADGTGKETEAPMNELFELGAFTKAPGDAAFNTAAVLNFGRHTLTTGQQTVSLVVDQQPAWAGVDPYHKRIDRNSEDNLMAVTLR